MGELLRGFGLAPEALADHLVARVQRAHHLDRARPVDEAMARRIHGRHAALAQDLFDQVAACDGDADQRILDRDQSSATQEATRSVVGILELALRTRLHG